MSVWEKINPGKDRQSGLDHVTVVGQDLVTVSVVGGPLQASYCCSKANTLGKPSSV